MTFGRFLDEELAAQAVQGLRSVPRRQRRRSLRLERIDGVPAGRSPLAPLLTSCGFVADYRGLRTQE